MERDSREPAFQDIPGWLVDLAKKLGLESGFSQTDLDPPNSGKETDDARAA